ncbi:MAG: hypothetical protein GSR79_00385 [Desulfurococcales archaeon]|nr:hypothetical protein [Desulfurococcales archaeon]
MECWRPRVAGVLAGFTGSVLLFDFPRVVGGRLWLTSGRVTYLVGERFSFTGNTMLDLLFFVVSLFFLVYLAWEGARRSLRILYVVLLPVVLVLAGSNYLVGSYVLLVVLLFSALIPFLVERGVLRGFLGGVLVFMAGLGLAALLEIAGWIVTGETVAHPLPLLLILVDNYVVWMLSPLLLFIAGVLGGVALVSPGYREKITGFLRLGGDSSGEGFVGGWGWFPWVPLAMLLGFIVTLVPYLPSVNPHGVPVTTDWVYYYKWLRDVDAVGLWGVLEQHMDRPLYIILLYGVERLFHVDPRGIAVYQIFFLGQLYVVASYFLGRSLGGERVGVLSALLAAVSPGFLSFMYGGFQSDFFTVSIVYFALGLIARAESGKRLVLGFIVFDLVMFLHEWTWTQYILVLSLYAAVLVVREYRDGGVSSRGRLLLGLVVLSVLVDVAKSPLGVRWPSSIVRVTNASKNMYLHRGVVSSNHFLTTIYTGGSLNNPLYYVLVVLGSLFSGPLLGAVLFLGLTPFALLHYVITYRVVVNTPLQVAGGLFASRLSGLELLLLYISLLSVALVFVACIAYTPLV